MYRVMCACEGEADIYLLRAWPRRPPLTDHRSWLWRSPWIGQDKTVCPCPCQLTHPAPHPPAVPVSSFEVWHTLNSSSGAFSSGSSQWTMPSGTSRESHLQDWDSFLSIQGLDSHRPWSGMNGILSLYDAISSGRLGSPGAIKAGLLLP